MVSTCFAGIDYSMTSPAVAVCNGHWSFANCKFYYLTTKTKFVWRDDKIVGEPFLDWSCPEERFYELAKWAVSKICKSCLVGIEGYSYGSKGKVFEIGENAGLLKHYLYKYGHPFAIVEPKTIKKYATGNGNADKDMMQSAFIEETGLNIKEILGMTKKSWNPSSDIIDAYYIGKYTYEFYEVE